jgi:hypothetical protein
MLRSHSGLLVLNNDHRPANAPTIARDVYCAVVMVDVHAHEFANVARTSQFAEVRDKPCWVASQADDRAVDHNNVTILAVDFGTGPKAYICRGYSKTHGFNKKGGTSTHLQHQAQRQA